MQFSARLTLDRSGRKPDRLAFERLPERFGGRRVELGSNAGIPEDCVESVEDPRDLEHFGSDACFAEAFRVGEVFIVEEVECPDADPGGR